MFQFTLCRTGVARHLTAVLLLGLGLLAPAPARAKPAPDFRSAEEIFTIRNVAVDETDATASAAREIALRAARRMAFSRLSRRIVLPQDLVRLPLPSDESLSNMVSDFEITEEKTSGQRYLAVLTLRFNPESVRTLLRRNNLRHSETGAGRMLVIPLYSEGEARLLWEENDWHKAIGAAIAQQGAANDRLVPLVMPIGDAEDISALNAQQAVSADAKVFDALLRRYQAADALLMQAVLSQLSGAAGRAAINVTVSRSATPGENIQIERFEGGPGEMPAMVMQRAAASLVRAVEETWLNDTALDFAQQATLDAAAPLRTLQDWVRIQKRLKETPMIQRVDVQAMSVEGAQVTLHYLGTPEKLALALSQHGLSLTQVAGSWRLD